MVNKHRVFGCFTNYEGHEAGKVFGLKSVKDIDWKQQWFRFCNQSDRNPKSSISVCKKRFVRQNAQQPRPINKLNPVHAIHPACLYDDNLSSLPTSSQARKPPEQRVFQQDELSSY